MIREGAILILQEREDQLIKHGFTVQKDQENYKNSNVLVAMAQYLLMDDDDAEKDNHRAWLISREGYSILPDLLDKFDNKSYVERLTVAGALLAAAIDFELNQENKT